MNLNHLQELYDHRRALGKGRVSMTMDDLAFLLRLARRPDSGKVGEAPLWTFPIDPPQGFIDYVAANYKGEVVLSNPAWHAMRLWNSAMRNAKLELASPAADSAATEQAEPDLQMRDPVSMAMALVQEWDEAPQDTEDWGNRASVHLNRMAKALLPHVLQVPQPTKRSDSAAEPVLTATHGPLHLTNPKTASIVQRGYNIVGYVLRRSDGEEVCLSAESAVRWLPQAHYWRLMHEQDGSLFAAAPASADVGELPKMKDELKQRRASMYSSGLASLSDIEFLERLERAIQASSAALPKVGELELVRYVRDAMIASSAPFVTDDDLSAIISNYRAALSASAEKGE